MITKVNGVGRVLPSERYVELETVFHTVLSDTSGSTAPMGARRQPHTVCIKRKNNVGRKKKRNPHATGVRAFQFLSLYRACM